jgi:hypothetical protein
LWWNTFLAILNNKHNEKKIQIISSNSIFSTIHCTKFLVLILDSTLSCNYQITVLTSRLNRACYAVSAIKPIISVDVMKLIYYYYVHSALSYGIIFWGNSHLNDSVFKIKKKWQSLLQILVDSNLVVNYLIIYKYSHFILNIFSHYLSLSTGTQFALYLVLILKKLINVLTIIYICLLQIEH